MILMLSIGDLGVLLGSFWQRLGASSCFLSAPEAAASRGDVGCHFGSKSDDFLSQVRLLAWSGY